MSTGGGLPPFPSAADKGRARPPSSVWRATPSRVELAEASINAHRLCLRFEEGGGEIPDALEAEAPHAGLVAAEVGVRAVGRRVERDWLALHLLDHRSCGEHVLDRHAGRQPALADLEVAELGDRVLLVLQRGPGVESLRDVVQEIERRNRVGLVAEQAQKAGG